MPQIHQPPHNKIVLKGSYTEGGVEQDEGILATAPALPGMNVALQTAVESIKRNTYAPGGGPAINVVTELLNVLEGKTIEDAYAVGSQFSFFKPKKGDVLQVLVLAAENLAKGAVVTAAASGKWTAVGADTPMARTIESTGGALAADTLVRVEIL